MLIIPINININVCYYENNLTMLIVALFINKYL